MKKDFDIKDAINFVSCNKSKIVKFKNNFMMSFKNHVLAIYKTKYDFTANVETEYLKKSLKLKGVIKLTLDGNFLKINDETLTISTVAPDFPIKGNIGKKYYPLDFSFFSSMLIASKLIKTNSKEVLETCAFLTGKSVVMTNREYILEMNLDCNTFHDLSIDGQLIKAITSYKKVPNFIGGNEQNCSLFYGETSILSAPWAQVPMPECLDLLNAENRSQLNDDTIEALKIICKGCKNPITFSDYSIFSQSQTGSKIEVECNPEFKGTFPFLPIKLLIDYIDSYTDMGHYIILHGLGFKLALVRAKEDEEDIIDEGDL